MSMTAIFRLAPQRGIAVGPSAEGSTVTYRNPGLSLRIYDQDKEKSRFVDTVALVRSFAIKDRWVPSLAEATLSVSGKQSAQLMRSYADASAFAVSKSQSLIQPEIEFVVSPATASMVSSKSKIVSVEV